MANRTKSARPAASHDLGLVRHAVWKAAHEAGNTHNGHLTRAGGPMGNHKSKAAHSKKACRSKPGHDD